VPSRWQSLASGRLYNQAEAMLRYYKRPALLIECVPAALPAIHACFSL
jgi:ERCC4-type nuclease